MILRDPLIWAARECREIPSVSCRNGVGHVAAGLIPGTSEGSNVSDRVNRERRRLARKPLVDEHFLVGRMIHDEQRDVVDEMRLPQLGGDANVVGSIASGARVAANLHPVLPLPTAP